MDGKGKTKYRFSSTEIYYIGFIALTFDAITLIPFAGDFLAPIFWIFFSYYIFIFKGIKADAKKLATEAIDILLKLIPGIQEFPEISLGVFIIIAITRVEDKIKAKTGINPGIIGKDGTLNKKAFMENKEKILNARGAVNRYLGNKPEQDQKQEGSEDEKKQNTTNPNTKLDRTRLANIGNHDRNQSKIKNNTEEERIQNEINKAHEEKNLQDEMGEAHNDPKVIAEIMAKNNSLGVSSERKQAMDRTYHK